MDSHYWKRNFRSYLNPLVLCVGFVLLLWTSGCSSTPDPAPKPPGDFRPILWLGAIPSESSDKVQDQYKDFLTYLERQTGFRVELVVAQDYNGVIEKMRKKELDFAFFGPFSYILAHETAGARALASPDFKLTGSSYSSVIISHQATGIKNVGQLKGHSFGFIDPDSTSGYLVPKAVMMKQGIDLEKDFSRIVFLGRHDAAILAVKNKAVDAAAVSSNVLKNLMEKGIFDENEIKVVFSSNPIPQSVWAYREGIPAETVNKVKQAFLGAHLEPGALGVYAKDVSRFIPREDKEYDIIRETAKLLNYKGK